MTYLYLRIIYTRCLFSSLFLSAAVAADTLSGNGGVRCSGKCTLQHKRFPIVIRPSSDAESTFDCQDERFSFVLLLLLLLLFRLCLLYEIILLLHLMIFLLAYFVLVDLKDPSHD